MLPLLSAVGWAIVAIMSFYVWVRIISKSRKDPSYIESLKEAGIYQRYQIGKFASFLLVIISFIFFMTSIAFTDIF